MKDNNNNEYAFYGIIPILNVKAYFLILIRTNIVGEEVDPLKQKLDEFYNENVIQVMIRIVAPFLVVSISGILIFKYKVINKLK